MSDGSVPRKSRELERFDLYLRRGLILREEESELKFNPYHDPDDGRFTFAPGGGTLPPKSRASRSVTMTARVQREMAAAGPSYRGPTRNPAPQQQPHFRVRDLLKQRPRPSGLTEDVVLAAQASERAHGVPAAITLAQYGLESAWGNRMPAGSNNPFGIKARPGEPFVARQTLEQDRQGRAYVVTAKFRKYASIGEAFEAHARLLGRPSYFKAQSARTTDDYADALTGVYATDRQYGTKLKRLIRQHGLDDFGDRSVRQPRRF